MITFAPGPSKVYDQLPQYFQDAYEQGILSANHRSAAFMDMYKETEILIREKLAVPQDYRLLFTSSATENWEIITQSLVEKASYHIFSGSFGKKWFGFAKHIQPGTASLQLDPDQEIGLDTLDISSDFDWIALTQNETSNATQVSNGTIEAIKNKYPDKMIAVDTTSSMAGVYLQFDLADVWYASVQKCFGLPAGLGILLISPKAIQKMQAKGEKGRYNSLSFMVDNAKNFQTHYTPNVLGIYLLYRSLRDIPSIHKTHQKTEQRMGKLEKIIQASDSLDFLVKNPRTRSRTVLGISGEEAFIQKIKKDAEKAGLQMGSGYGPLKPTSFRIANFPAINEEEFNRLTRFLSDY